MPKRRWKNKLKLGFEEYTKTVSNDIIKKTRRNGDEAVFCDLVDRKYESILF